MSDPELVVERWNNSHSRWTELMAFEDVDHLNLESKAEDWHLGIYTLVALFGRDIAGVLRFWTQEIGIDEDKPVSIVNEKPAIEAKIVTFHVLENYRQQGVGRALQLAAIRWARQLDCYQVRSRSAYVHSEYHSLQISLGLGISPGRNTTDGSRDTAFFVFPIKLAKELIEEI